MLPHFTHFTQNGELACTEHARGELVEPVEVSNHFPILMHLCVFGTFPTNTFTYPLISIFSYFYPFDFLTKISSAGSAACPELVEGFSP
jgi:hypothetical protein